MAYFSSRYTFSAIHGATKFIGVLCGDDRHVQNTDHRRLLSVDAINKELTISVGRLVDSGNKKTMKQTTFEDGVAAMLDSLLNDRFTILVGAGLSMAPPTCLPDAATLAANAKQKYDAIHGASRDPLPSKMEDQAEFFFQRNELESVYFRTLIDRHAFGGPPNKGHYAIADFLLARALQTAVTTNVDIAIEAAGLSLFGEIAAVIDGDLAAALPATTSPLLKIHGCRVQDPKHMVWAPGQLLVKPAARRIQKSAAWLQVHLVGRDLLIVGFWSDWDYLNSILRKTLGAISPARVVVVNPDDPAKFKAKAPDLYSLGKRATVSFEHVCASGADFLDVLRREFSRTYIRRIVHSAKADYLAEVGTAPEPAWLDCTLDDTTSLWQIRRDLEGRFPQEPAQHCSPQDDEPLVGLTILMLQARGAVPEGSYWLLAGKRIRVLRAVNKYLHRVEAAFEREVAPTVAPDIVIAVGAEAQSLAKSIARPRPKATIARGTASRWMTRSEAIDELGL